MGASTRGATMTQADSCMFSQVSAAIVEFTLMGRRQGLHMAP